MSVILLPKQNDKKIIEIIKKIIDEIDFHVTGSIITGSVFSKNIDDSLENKTKEFTSKTFLISNFNLDIGNHSFKFSRADERSPNPFIDKIEIHADRNYVHNNKTPIDENAYIKICKIIYEDFGAINLYKNIELQSGKDAAQIATLHNQTLQRLEETNLNLIQQLQSYRNDIDNQKIEYQKSLDANFLDRKKILHDEIEAEKNNIRIENEKIQNIKKELDDKSNTHARRQIRKEIFEEIKRRQEKFTLTSSTQRMRMPIKAAFIMLISVLLLLSFYTAIQIAHLEGFGINLTNTKETTIIESNNQFNWQFLLLIFKQTISIAALIGIFIMYIRWEDRWMQTHADNEFHLKRFALDIERANWLVETGLEWKEAKGNAMPQELMLSLSKNLFEDEKSSQEEKIKPLNQLASSIIGSASLVKLRAGDSEIEINPNKLKKEKDIAL